MDTTDFFFSFGFFILMAAEQSEEFLELGACLTGNQRERDFRAHFGGPSIAIDHLWRLIQTKHQHHLPHLWGCDELLQTLCFLKSPGQNLTVSSSRFKIDQRTLMKNVEKTLEVIDQTLPEVIFFFFNKSFYSSVPLFLFFLFPLCGFLKPLSLLFSLI